MIKKNKKESKMTIDKLAIIIAKSFEKTATKNDIEKIERRIAELENNLIYHIGSVNRRLDDMSINRVKYEDFDTLKKRVKNLEKA